MLWGRRLYSVTSAYSTALLAAAVADYDDFDGVGGHGGLLRGDGVILKPVSGPHCHHAAGKPIVPREQAFYEEITAHCKDSLHKDSVWCTILPA